jgi:hypothetical protein
MTCRYCEIQQELNALIKRETTLKKRFISISGADKKILEDLEKDILKKE